MSWFQSVAADGQRARRRRLQHHLPVVAAEVLEDRQLLAGDPVLQNINNTAIVGVTGEKPQSKVWQQGGSWFSCYSNDNGTSIFRLDGTSWTQVLNLSNKKSVKADVKVVGNVVHLLLERGTASQLASVQFVAGSGSNPGTYELWNQRPALVDISIDVEVATIDVDTSGRMWMAYTLNNQVIARYSDGNYSNWSAAPIVLASGLKSDDIASVVSFDGKIGVFWSNQTTQRFGFRVHTDGAAATTWGADEVPAAAFAKNVGGGFADDHMNLQAVGGTLFAAVKTSYDRSGETQLALLVRNSSGQWGFHDIDGDGTRPIIQASPSTNTLLYIYRDGNSSGPIVYRQSTLNNISFGAEKVLISGTVLNDASATKANFGSELVVIAAGQGTMSSTRMIFGAVTNQPPNVNAGQDLVATFPNTVQLEGNVFDDGFPGPTTSTWTKFSGGGTVTFGDNHSPITTATFSAPGEYILRLTANDGQFTTFDDVKVTVSTSGQQVTYSFQDGVNGYTGTRDTKLRSDLPTRNFGSATTLEMDGNPDFASLLKWDLSTIPSNVTVVSASITLNVDNTSTATFELYQMLKAWTETGATYDEYATGQAWSVGGANGTSGQNADRGNTVLGVLTSSTAGLKTFELNAAGLAVVQGWLANPASNNGFIGLDYADASTDDLDVSSSEDAVAKRPKLTIVVSTGPVEPTPNAAPEVNAGPDRDAFANTAITLDGTVTDDNQPAPPSLITTWTASGPGTVVFGNASNVDTTVTFSAAGTYTLRLTANDGDLQTFDEIIVEVQPPGSAAEATFQDGVNGYTGTRDTKLRADLPTTNFGTSNQLEADGSPDFASLIKWDVSSIPAGSQIKTASITINVTNTTTATFELYQMLRSWVETEATAVQYAAGQNWAVAGANGTASGNADRGTTALGVFTTNTLGLLTVNLNAAGIAVIQSWITNPSLNRGFILMDYDNAATDDLDFNGREISTVANRPLLTITYTASGAGLNAGSPPPASGGAPVAGVTSTAMQPIITAAINKWAAAASSPASAAAIRALLSGVTFGIVDLPTGMLSRASGNTIEIDFNANGNGWFVDTTPTANSEFNASGVANAGGPAAGKFDLLSAVVHEMGHVLGYDHGVLGSSLSIGTRQFPTILSAGSIDSFFASSINQTKGSPLLV